MRRFAFMIMVSLSALAGFAQAQQEPQEGDKALFLSNVFNESNYAFEAVGLPDGSTYHAGYFISSTVMPYASVRIINHEDGTNFGLGGGARMYTDATGPLRTYIDAGLTYTKLDDAGGNRTNNLGANTGNSARIVTLGGFLGAEYLFNPNVSVGLKVGGTYSDFGGDYDFSTLDLGVSELQFNLYF